MLQFVSLNDAYKGDRDMKTIILTALASTLACFALSGCATDSAVKKDGQVAQNGSFTHTGSSIPRAKGKGTGAAQVGTAEMNELENARIMMNTGLKKY